MSGLDFQADETIEEETIIHRKRTKRTIRPESAVPRAVQAVIDATSQMNKTKVKQLPAAKQDTPKMRSQALPPSSAKTPQQQRLTKIFNLTRGTVGRKVDSDELTAFAETKTLATLAYALTHEKSVTKAAANTLFVQAVQTLYHVPAGRNIPVAVLKRDWHESLARLSERRPLIRAKLSAAEARGLDAVARIKGIPAQFVLSDEIHDLLDTTPEKLFRDIYWERHAWKLPQTQEDVFHDAEVQRYYRVLRRIDDGEGINQSWLAFQEDWNDSIAQVVLKAALPSDAKLKETRRRVAQLNAQKTVWSRQNKELRNQLFKPVPTTAGGKTLEKLIEENMALWERMETERDVWTKRNNTLRDQLNQSAVKASPTQTLKDMKAENASLKETLAKVQQSQVRTTVQKNERQNRKNHQDKIRFLDENRDNHTVPGYLPTAMPTMFDVDATWNEMDREEAFQAHLDDVERRNLIVPEAAAANLINTELRDVHDYQDITDKINRKRAKIQPSAVRPKAPNTSFTLTIPSDASDNFTVTPTPTPASTPKPEPVNQHNALKKWLAVAAVVGTVSIATLVAFLSIGKKDKQETRVAQAAPTHQTAPKPTVKQATPVTNTPKIVQVNTERAPYPRMTGTRVVRANWSAFHRDHIGGAKIPQYGKDKVILENEYNFFLEAMKRNNISIADAIADKSATQQLLGPKVSVYTVDGTIIDQFSVDNVDACAEMINHYRYNLKTVLAGMTPDQQVKYMAAVGPSVGLSTFQQETWQKLHPNEVAQALKTISADVRDRQLSNPGLSLFDATVDAIADFRETHPDNQALSLIGHQVISRYQAKQQVQTASRDNTAPMDNPANNSPEQPEKSGSNTGKKLAWTTAAAGIVAGILYNRGKKEK